MSPACRCGGASVARAPNRGPGSRVRHRCLSAPLTVIRVMARKRMSGHAPVLLLLVAFRSGVAFLSRGGGFCPPRAITRGQVAIGTPHWRNKRGAAYTGFVLLFFRQKFLPFCAQGAPKTRRFFSRARPRGKQSRNSRAWPVHRPKQDSRVRTSKTARPKAAARLIQSACRLPQCGPISDNSDSGPI
jgi:hypothetical protein